MVNSGVADSPSPSRVLFTRIGSMTYYAGPQPGDERPRGGGAYNKKNLGHELFNFANFGGRLYGFVRAKSGHVDLARIDPSAGSAKTLDDVLVIFVARQHIVGWYRQATVHADTAPLPGSAAKEMRSRLQQAKVRNFELLGYRFEADAGGATLLPTGERKLKMPGNVKGGFGQSNVRYQFRRDGTRYNSPWMQKAIQYVMKYDKANLLHTPEAEANAAEAATVAQERAAGFQSNPRIRRLIEDYAMKAAQKELEKRGYSEFQDTSATKPYDLVCRRDGEAFFVEVKGTQTAGSAILLTKNEVKHVTTNANKCILVIVHSVVLSKKAVAKKGTPEVIEKWDFAQGELSAIQYMWRR